MSISCYGVRDKQGDHRSNILLFPSAKELGRRIAAGEKVVGSSQFVNAGKAACRLRNFWQKPSGTD